METKKLSRAERRRKKDHMEESIMCFMYNSTNGEVKEQSMKRKNVVGLKVSFRTDNDEPCIGILKGFFEHEDGHVVPMVEEPNGKMPKADSPLYIIRRVYNAGNK